MKMTKKQKAVICIAGTLFLISLTMYNPAYASQKPQAKPDDPNEQLLKKYDTVVKDPNDPNEMLVAKWNAIMKVLQDKSLEQKMKQTIIGRLMIPVFDFELMSRLSLGKTNLSKLSSSELAEFTKLFTELLKNSYQDKIMSYTNQKVLFKPPVKEKNTVNIPMVIVSSDSDTTIIYKLRKTAASWKIYDVEIQGVSILQTYRSQFDDILAKGTAKDLLSKLKQTKPQS